MAAEPPEAVAETPLAPKPVSGNAIASLAVFIPGFLIPLVLHAVGLVFGILGLRETGPAGRRRGRALALLGIVLNGIAVLAVCLVVVAVVYFGIIKKHLG